MAKTLSELVKTPEQIKLDYVNTQISEMEAIILRNDVDIYIIDNTEKTDKEARSAEVQRNQFTDTNEQLEKALTALRKLRDELNK